MTLLFGVLIAFVTLCCLMGVLLAKWKPAYQPSFTNPAANTVGEPVAIPCQEDPAGSDSHGDGRR